MVRLHLVVAVLALAACCSNAEARGGRRMAYQPAYTQYYNTTTPTYTTVTPANTVVSQPVVVQPSAAAQTNGVVQTSGTSSDSGIVQANAVQSNAASTSAPSTSTSTTPASTTAPATIAAPAAPGSAQWKAEQCARMGAVMHLGGGFGGGSYEGCGFGATPDQAIQTACFWGQRQAIEIGVARGANGYYSTIFYR